MKKFLSTVPDMYYNYILDVHGSVIGLADERGTVISYEYDAWGNLLNTPDETVLTGNGEKLVEANPFRYSSYQYDRESGYYYLKYRYYSPFTGRFMSMDPVVSYNRYMYCSNNPVNYVDPLGLAQAYLDGDSIVIKRMGNAVGKVDAPNISTALTGATTGYDTIAGGYLAGGASATTNTIANSIYRSAISNSSSKVEAYRKMLDVANSADEFRLVSTKLTGTGIKSIGTKLGVAGAVVGGGIQIGSDLMNDNYSNTDKAKAVIVDTVQMGASIGVVVGVSMLIPGVGWGIAAGIVLGIAASTAINYGAQAWKDEWIDSGR